MRSLRRGGFLFTLKPIGPYATTGQWLHSRVLPFDVYPTIAVLVGAVVLYDIPIYRNTTCCDYGDADCSLI